MQRLAISLAVVGLTAACGGSGGTGGGGGTPTSPGSSLPPPVQNRTPSISSVTVSPSFGISELTSFSFNASATDPDGDALTYTWDVAGNPASGPGGSITFRGSGVAAFRVTVTDGRGGTVSDSRSATVGSATGTWRGAGVQLGSFTMQLQQNGPLVTGTYSDAFGGGQIDPAQPGSINAQGHIEMRVKQGPFTDWNFRGDMDTSGRRIVGQIFGSGFNGQGFTLEKQ